MGVNIFIGLAPCIIILTTLRTGVTIIGFEKIRAYQLSSASLLCKFDYFPQFPPWECKLEKKKETCSLVFEFTKIHFQSNYSDNFISADIFSVDPTSFSSQPTFTTFYFIFTFYYEHCIDPLV